MYSFTAYFSFFPRWLHILYTKRVYLLDTRQAFWFACYANTGTTKKAAERNSISNVTITGNIHETHDSNGSVFSKIRASSLSALVIVYALSYIWAHFYPVRPQNMEYPDRSMGNDFANAQHLRCSRPSGRKCKLPRVRYAWVQVLMNINASIAQNTATMEYLRNTAKTAHKTQILTQNGLGFV